MNDAGPRNRSVRDGAGGGRTHQLRVLAEHTLRELVGQRLPTGPAGLELVRVDVQSDGTLGDVDADAVPVAYERDGPAVDRLRGEVAHAQARRAAGETPVGQQQHIAAQAGALDRRGDGQHL